MRYLGAGCGVCGDADGQHAVPRREPYSHAVLDSERATKGAGHCARGTAADSVPCTGQGPGAAIRIVRRVPSRSGCGGQADPGRCTWSGRDAEVAFGCSHRTRQCTDTAFDRGCLAHVVGTGRQTKFISDELVAGLAGGAAGCGDNAGLHYASPPAGGCTGDWRAIRKACCGFAVRQHRQQS